MIALACLTLTLAGCESREAVEVPDAKAEFVGRWSSGPNYFELGSDGEVNLELEGPSQTLYYQSAALGRFEDDSVCIHIGTPKGEECFSISKAPYPSDNQVMIRVEGIELTRE